VNATTLGSLLVGVGGIVGAVVAYLGKRGETAVTGYSNLTNDLQEERDALRVQVAELHALRAADQAEITRLRIENAHLGGPT
jgi:predicted dinucleotide-binding enzyme